MVLTMIIIKENIKKGDNKIEINLYNIKKRDLIQIKETIRIDRIIIIRK